MIRSWQEISVQYERSADGRPSMRSLAELAQWISQSALAGGLFAWVSMNDLCIVQTEVTYPYDGPRLRLSPVSKDQIEFRYVDTLDKSQQWQRTVDAAEAPRRLIAFLDQLRWFPTEVLETLRRSTRCRCASRALAARRAPED
jgi:hypothetical protein